LMRSAPGVRVPNRLLRACRAHAFQSRPVAMASAHMELPARADAAKEACTVVLFPGNPGHAPLYTEALAELQAQSPRFGRCVAVSYLGHGERPTEGWVGPWKLEEQVEYACGVVRKLGEETGSSSIILVGHSIGAHVMTEVLRREAVPLERVESAIALMPFIHNSPEVDSRIWELRVASRLPRTLGVLVSLLSSTLPQSQLQWLVEAIAGLEPVSAQRIANVLCGSVLRNCLYMGRNEFEVLREAPDYSFYGTLGSKLIVGHSLDDRWAPAEVIARMREAAPEATFVGFGDKVQHDFVVVAEHCAFVAGEIAAALERAGQSEPSTGAPALDAQALNVDIK